MKMKAQAALVEALVASLILAGAGAFAARELYSASSSGVSQQIAMQNALFDIESITYANAGPGGCIVQMDLQCIRAALASINRHYRLSYSSIQVGNLTVAAGNYLRCAGSDYYCFPVGSSNDSMQVCEYLCSD